MNPLQSITVAGWILLAVGAKAATTTPGSVQGKTVDAEGHPVAGAVVQQFGYRRLANGYDSERQQQATSGPDGIFEVQLSRSSPLPQVPSLLVARKPGLAVAWTQVQAASGTDLRLVLAPSSFLGGKVVDEADKPVPGADVHVVVAYSETTGDGSSRSFNYLSDKAARESFSSKTGPDGRFRIENFPTNASAALLAEASGKVQRSTGQQFFNPDSMPYRAGQDDIQLVMEPAGGVEGKILAGEAGEKPPTAQIHVLPNGPGMIALGSRPADKSEPDGTFRLNNLLAGSYRLQAIFGTNTPADWVAETVSITVESGQTTQGVQITAIRGGFMEITVRSSKGGEPIDDVGINAYREGYPSGVASASNGVALLRLPPGDYQVGAYKEGWQQANASGSVEAGKTNQVEMELAPPQKLAGIVHSPDGQPAANLMVQIVGDYAMQQASLKTGPDGRFEMAWSSQRNPGNNMTPCVLIRDPEHNLAVAQDLDEDSEKLDLRLAPAVSFATRVECDGKPVTNATAALVFWAGNSGMHLNGLSSRTNLPGQIEVMALPLGRRYGLQVSANGYGSKYVDLAQSAHQANRVELDPVELKRADRKLAGKLVDTDDKPVSGTRVQVNGDGQPNANVVTDRDGRFSFDVCEGRVRLFANRQRSFANISAEAGDTNVVLKLGERAVTYGEGAKPQKVRGTVTDPSGNAVASAEVRVFPMEMPSRSKTDTHGAFNVTYIIQPWQRQNGSSPLLIVRDKARNLAAAQEVSDDNTNVTVQLEPALTVKGHVIDIDAKPLANAQVNLILQANRMGGQIDEQPITTDAQGGFTFTALPMQQDYNVYASLLGYGQKHQKVEADWDTNVVELPPIALRVANQIIAGQVLNDKDKPVSGVHVQLSADDQPQGFMQTDSKGRFRFKVCEGQVRLFASGMTGFAQATTEAGDTNVIIVLTDRSVRMQGVAGRSTPRGRANPSALKGKPLPDLASLGFAADVAPVGKPVLLCLIDVQQRPSRRITRLLGDQQPTLREKGVAVLAAQTVPASNESWDDWKEANPVPFPVSRLAEKTDKTKWASGLEILPWLILVDRNGIVVDEGFSLEELETKIQELNN
jgi:protocatechuate 3,4-dioxygenase beta subunit